MVRGFNIYGAYAHICLLHCLHIFVVDEMYFHERLCVADTLLVMLRICDRGIRRRESVRVLRFVRSLLLCAARVSTGEYTSECKYLNIIRSAVLKDVIYIIYTEVYTVEFAILTMFSSIYSLNILCDYCKNVYGDVCD